jgi:gluconokinase
MTEPRREPWFLGVDLGTGSCKALVVGAEARVLGFASADYAAGEAEERWREQDPAALVEGMVRAVRGAVERAQAVPEACAGMSLGGALHSLVVLDGAGRPLTGVSTWADDRAANQAAAIAGTDLGRELYRRTGCVPHGLYPLYKILWLREERPEVFRQARRLVSAKEYVLAELTGEWLVDYSIATGSGFMNVHDLTWDPLPLEVAGIGPEKLSRPGDARLAVAGLKAGLAARMGLSPRTPLFLGSSDAANSSLGAGTVHPWQVTCMVGTSGALRLISPRPLLDENGRTWCYAVDAGHWIVGGAINNGGVALSWLRDLLHQPFPDLPPELHCSFEDLADLAGRVPPGAGGVVCLPFLAGERSPNWNLSARACFLGLKLDHGAGHLARSLLEGVAFRLRSVLRLLVELNPGIREVRASGGFTNSPLWLRIVGNVLNRELAIPAWGETSCLGAALWALMGGGALASLEEAGRLVRISRTTSPDPAEAGLYDRAYSLYQDLYVALSPFFPRLGGIEPPEGGGLGPP